jgi:hypothetical protein
VGNLALSKEADLMNHPVYWLDAMSIQICESTTNNQRGRSMAIVRNIEKGVVSGKPHPTFVDAKWAGLLTGQGTYWQLSTFGSDQRASKPKVSQTIQLDEESARAIVASIYDVFPRLRSSNLT